jgi:hypothetical protein
MTQLEREYDIARLALKARIGRLITTAEAADSDSWGTDIFRRLLSYARAVDLELDADLFRGASTEQALARLPLLGAELSLHQWVDVWPEVSEYNAVVADTLAAALALRDVVRARGAGVAAT